MIDTFKITGAEKKHNYEKVRKMIQFPLYRKKIRNDLWKSQSTHFYGISTPCPKKITARLF